MATHEELRAAMDDYVTQARQNDQLKRALGTWHCVIAIEATDIQGGYTMTIDGGDASVSDGLPATPDLIVRGSSEDLTDIFWCDANPAGNYMQGAVKILGPQEHTMKLDAMALMVYMGVQSKK